MFNSYRLCLSYLFWPQVVNVSVPEEKVADFAKVDSHDMPRLAIQMLNLELPDPGLKPTFLTTSHEVQSQLCLVLGELSNDLSNNIQHEMLVALNFESQISPKNGFDQAYFDAAAKYPFGRADPQEKQRMILSCFAICHQFSFATCRCGSMYTVTNVVKYTFTVTHTW